MKLFIDIETVPGSKIRNDGTVDISPEEYELYMKRHSKAIGEVSVAGLCSPAEAMEAHYRENAGMSSEFGKIVCVSMGYIQSEKIVLRSFAGHDEKIILEQVAAALGKATSIVAHNGKNFDYPWLCRRMLIHGIPLPALLQIQNLKPWEVKLEDTMEMWRFGQFNASVSLACLCHLFGLPSPKQGMDGSMVATVYYRENDLSRIVTYCEADIIALVNVYRKLQYLQPITEPQPAAV